MRAALALSRNGAAFAVAWLVYTSATARRSIRLFHGALKESGHRREEQQHSTTPSSASWSRHEPTSHHVPRATVTVGNHASAPPAVNRSGPPSRSATSFASTRTSCGAGSMATVMTPQPEVVQVSFEEGQRRPTTKTAPRAWWSRPEPAFDSATRWRLVSIVRCTHEEKDHLRRCSVGGRSPVGSRLASNDDPGFVDGADGVTETASKFGPRPAQTVATGSRQPGIGGSDPGSPTRRGTRSRRSSIGRCGDERTSRQGQPRPGPLPDARARETSSPGTASRGAVRSRPICARTEATISWASGCWLSGPAGTSGARAVQASLRRRRRTRTMSASPWA